MSEILPGEPRSSPPEEPGQAACRIALVSIYDTENNAVRLMASILRRSGYYAAEIYFKDWKNNALEPPSRAELDSLLKILSGERITLAALSLRASAYLKTAAMLTGLIREKAGIPVLWGGAHAILCPEESARIADIVCVGEGEEAILDLAGRLSTGVSIDDTPNFWVRRGDEIIRNPISNLIQDLDSIPFRDYTSLDKFVIDGGRVTRRDPMIEDPVFQVITSRGCPYQCSYCYNSTYREIFRDKGKYCRKRSVDNVILELKQAKSLFKNLKRIKFDDEVFPFQKEWVDEFVQKYPVQVGLPFEAFTEPSLVEPELFARLKEAGLQIVYMGIQSSERITRQLYDRAAPKEQVRRAAGVLHGLGLDTRFQVIIDDPLSGPEDREELFRLLMSLERPFELYLFSLTVFPNTGLARRLLKDGLITPGQIEGEDTKTFRQLRVDLSYPRDPLSTYWAAMLVLLSKSFIPPWLLWKFFGNEGLRRNPRPLVILAQVSNFLKMAWVAAGMLLRGELTWVGAKRWLNLKSLITQ